MLEVSAAAAAAAVQVFIFICSSRCFCFFPLVDKNHEERETHSET